jgi:hypothetical protein
MTSKMYTTWSMNRVVGVGLLAFLSSAHAQETKRIGARPATNASDYSTEVTTQSEYEYTIDKAPTAPAEKPQQVPEFYQVQQGDTLGGVSKRFFGTPFEWPRIWSYNPDITNPNWIYPSTKLRLVSEQARVEELPRASPSGMRLVALGAGSHKKSVYLRHEGFVDKDVMRHKGIIAGSPNGQMLLSENDRVYVQFDHDVRATRGQEWSVFRNIRLQERDIPQQGILVRISGTVRVTSYDPKHRVASALVVESLEPIERGFSVAPALRSFEYVDPKPATRSVYGKVLGAVDPLHVLGEHQITFVNLGAKDGIEKGNRLFVVRTGDDWRKTLPQAERIMGTTLEKDTPEPRAYPEETIAELRVVWVRTNTAACYITRSTEAIELNDKVRTRAGY